MQQSDSQQKQVQNNNTPLKQQQKLDPKLYTLFRLDGHSFSKFVKKFQMKLPFDDNFTNAMKNTATQCFTYFKFFIGFVGSDQITFVMKPLSQENLEKKGTLQFNGRVEKMVSLLAGKVSTTFFIQLTKLEGFQKTRHFSPHFDCRVFQVLNFKEAMKCLSERVKYTLKNSRMMLAQTYFSPKQLNKVPSKKAVQLLAKQKGINYDQVVNADNRVGNVLLFEKVMEQKQIEVKGETKQISFQRKKCRLVNLGPKEVEQLKEQNLPS